MKKQMYDNFNQGLVSDNFDQDSDMYYAMYAYEQYGNATRDNSFEDLVSLGKELNNQEES